MRSEADDELGHAAKNESKVNIETKIASAVRLIIAYALTSSTWVNTVQLKNLTPACRGALHGLGGSTQPKMEGSGCAGLIRGIGCGNHFELDGFLLVGAYVDRFGFAF